MVTALAVSFLGEKVGMRRWTAIAIGFVGLLLIVRPGIGVFDPTALVPLGGACLWAVYQILVRKLSDDSAATSPAAACTRSIGRSRRKPEFFKTTDDLWQTAPITSVQLSRHVCL